MELNFEKIKSKKDLLTWISTHFNFPAYFWRNWDAVDECLSDFCIKDITISIKNPEMKTKEIENEIKIFEEIIQNFNASWDVKIHFCKK